MDDLFLRGALHFRACGCLHNNEIVAFTETEDELAELAYKARHEELGTMPSRMVSAVRRREAEAAKSLRAAIAASLEFATLSTSWL